MQRTMTRTGLLAGAAGLALAGAAPARAAEEDDLVLLRLAASAELVLTAFYYRARASRRFDARERAAFVEAQRAHGEHHRALARAIGPGAPTAVDFEIGFDADSFASRERVYGLRSRLESALVGVHLFAAAQLSTPELRALAAGAAASCATYAGELPAFPAALDVEAGSAAFTRYWG